MPIIDGSKPDLIFHYSLALPSTSINKIVNGNDIIQTANGRIFLDSENKILIGKFAFNITIFNIPEDNLEDGKPRTYEVAGTNVYYLPQGTISHSINLSFIKDGNGNFVVPPNETFLYQILSGSGNFLNERGLVVQLTNNNLGREIQVYFDK